MADQRDGGISWTQETWNPIRGCRRVNLDCVNCYAEHLAATRLANQPKYLGLATMTNGGARWTGQVRLDEDDLLLPLHWDRPRLVFVNAMSDLFYEELTDDQIDHVVAVMIMAARHTFQVLTKRPERMAAYLRNPNTLHRLGQLIARDYWHPSVAHPQTTPTGTAWPVPNIWWGASMGHRKAVHDFMPHLEACRPHAAVLWVSAEPLIEDTWDYLDFEPWLWKECPTCLGTMSVQMRGGGAPCPTCIDHQGLVPARIIDWMVAGGESGADARPPNVKVARQLRDDCEEAGVPFHWKQWGEWLPIGQSSPTLTQEAYDTCHARHVDQRVAGHEVLAAHRVGKKAAGRLLDGKLHNAWPKGYTPAGKAA